MAAPPVLDSKLGQRHEQLEHLGEVGGTESGYGIPLLPTVSKVVQKRKKSTFKSGIGGKKRRG